MRKRCQLINVDVDVNVEVVEKAFRPHFVFVWFRESNEI